MLRIELIQSPIGNTKRNRATVQALGLRKMHQVVVQPDNPSIRGLVKHAKHMLRVTEVEDVQPVAKAAPAPQPEPVAAPEPEAAEKPARKPRAKKESEPSESQ